MQPWAFQGLLDRELGDGRIAIERDVALLSYEDRYDDAALADMPASGLFRVPNPEPRATVPYTRPSSDEIRLTSSRAGVVRVLEAYDPVWSATLDGAPATVVDDDGLAMAVKVPAGKHED